jgi:hypothetical protein
MKTSTEQKKLQGEYCATCGRKENVKPVMKYTFQGEEQELCMCQYCRAQRTKIKKLIEAGF